MNGKELFKKYCTELGIDCDTFFKLGNQNPKITNRYVYKNSYLSRKESQLFAINYFKNDNIYIAWNLKEKKASTKSSFILLKNKIKFAFQEEVLRISKGIEYTSWDQEIAFVFQPTGIKNFLILYFSPKLDEIKENKK